MVCNISKHVSSRYILFIWLQNNATMRSPNLTKRRFKFSRMPGLFTNTSKNVVVSLKKIIRNRESRDRPGHSESTR